MPQSTRRRPARALATLREKNVEMPTQDARHFAVVGPLFGLRLLCGDRCRRAAVEGQDV
jgi:hypothetical protein